MQQMAIRQDLGWLQPLMPGGGVLSGGVVERSAGENYDGYTEQVIPGMKLVLVLAGSITYQPEGGRSTSLSSPSVHLSLCGAPYSVSHQFDHSSILRYVSVRLTDEILSENFACDISRLSRRLASASASRAGTIVDRRAGRNLQFLGEQMLDCPLQDGLRSLYLTGKALELVALSLGAVDGGTADAGKLRPRDIQSLHKARDFLIEHLDAPPGITGLARHVGINTNKLTRGFRQLFGQSVYEFVREQRLELAYRLLASHAMNVSDAAQVCGYTASHFTKVFFQRFGVLPSQLV